ncbi:MAG: SufE family protein [Candidatus Woesearchaeota archaeon]
MEYPKVFSIVTEDLNSLPGQKEKLEYLMEYGQEYNVMSEEHRTEENMVKGCIAKVYIRCIKRDNKIMFEGYSDSLIVRGYLRILCEAFSNITLGELHNESKEYLHKFIKESGITNSILPSRANTFGNIYSMMLIKAS